MDDQPSLFKIIDMWKYLTGGNRVSARLKLLDVSYATSLNLPGMINEKFRVNTKFIEEQIFTIPVWFDTL